MKRILLTGSNGFIGSALNTSFTGKYDVRVLEREKYPFQDKAKLIEACTDIDVVVHVGGLTRGNSDELIEANTVNTIRLFEAACAVAQPIRFVFASSFAVYQGSTDLLTGDSDLNPRNIYGFSKKWAEEALTFRQNNIEVVSLRIANVFGPKVPPFAQSVIATFIEQIKKELPVTVNGDGNQARDFVFISDVVAAFRAAIDAALTNPHMTYNICSGVHTSLNDVINGVAETLHKQVTVTYNPGEKETVTWIGDFAKAKKELHWEPQVTLKKGIELCVSES